MSTLDAIKDLITHGDTSHFIRSGRMIKISYYIDEGIGNMYLPMLNLSGSS